MDAPSLLITEGTVPLVQKYERPAGTPTPEAMGDFGSPRKVMSDGGVWAFMVATKRRNPNVVRIFMFEVSEKLSVIRYWENLEISRRRGAGVQFLTDLVRGMERA